MTNELFEQLLYEEESPTLDFKKEQYRFVKATDEEKSELLKDILGFANAWRRSDAYILIGVEDVRGGRGNVVGIPAAEQLDDHSLQQFVGNLTKPPVRFRYEAFEFEGKQVGVIRVEDQHRPVFLKRDYGKLQKNEVYVRRGSSTDPTKPAEPDEIAQMRVGAGPQTAELEVEFAEVGRDDSLGQHITWDAEFCEMPSMEAIPNLSPPRRPHPILGDLSFLGVSPTSGPNENYYRDLAEYEFARRLFRPVRLVVRNVGKVAASSVRAELTVPVGIGVMVVDRSALPDLPSQRAEFFKAALRNIRPALQTPGDVTIDKNNERFKVEIDCGDLQPGRRVWSGVFFVGKRTSGDLCLAGQVFAANLPQPKDFQLAMTVNVTEKQVTVKEILDLPEPTPLGTTA